MGKYMLPWVYHEKSILSDIHPTLTPPPTPPPTFDLSPLHNLGMSRSSLCCYSLREWSRSLSGPSAPMHLLPWAEWLINSSVASLWSVTHNLLLVFQTLKFEEILTWVFKTLLGICCVDARDIHLLSQELGETILCFPVVIRMSITSLNKAKWVL